MPDFPSTLRVPNYGSNPGSPFSGQVYWNSGDKQLYYYNGTAWVALGLSSNDTGGNVVNVGTPTNGQLAQWTGATSIQGIADTTKQWDGGSTGLTASTGRTSLGASATGAAIFTTAGPGTNSWLKATALGTVSYEDAATTRTSLGLVIGTNVQAWSSALDTWATTTNNSGNWNTAFTNNLRWDGGATSLVAATGRRSLVIGDAEIYENASASGASFGATEIAVIGSVITIPTAGGWTQGGQYHCVFDMSKTLGTGAIVINVHMGTAGTTGDATVGTITFGAAGTSVADAGIIDFYVTFKSVGSGTSAVIVMYVRVNKVLTTTGLVNSGTNLYMTFATSAGFNSTTPTKISLGFTGGTAFSGTSVFTQTRYIQ